MKTELIVIFRGNPADAGIVHEILNDNGIMANLRNELMGSIAPWYVSPGGANPIEVEILDKDKDAAQELIDAFLNQ